MNKGKGVVAAIAIGLMASVGWAADKSSSSFVDASSLAGGSNGFSNGVSSGKDKSASCKVKIQIKGLTGFVDGDQLICIAEADVKAPPLLPGPAGNSVVIHVTYDGLKGQAAAKADLSQIGCGGQDAINIGGDLKCYKPDAGYDPAAACAAAGMGWGVGNAVEPLVGLCQGVSNGQRIQPPASGLICQHGGFNPLK